MLPVDLVLSVCHYLPAAEVAALSALSKDLRSTLSDLDEYWQLLLRRRFPNVPCSLTGHVAAQLAYKHVDALVKETPIHAIRLHESGDVTARAFFVDNCRVLAAVLGETYKVGGLRYAEEAEPQLPLGLTRHALFLVQDSLLLKTWEQVFFNESILNTQWCGSSGETSVYARAALSVTVSASIPELHDAKMTTRSTAATEGDSTAAAVLMSSLSQAKHGTAGNNIPPLSSSAGGAAAAAGGDGEHKQPGPSSVALDPWMPALPAPPPPTRVTTEAAIMLSDRRFTLPPSVAQSSNVADKFPCAFVPPATSEVKGQQQQQQQQQQPECADASAPTPTTTTTTASTMSDPTVRVKRTLSGRRLRSLAVQCLDEGLINVARVVYPGLSVDSVRSEFDSLATEVRAAIAKYERWEATVEENDETGNLTFVLKDGAEAAAAHAPQSCTCRHHRPQARDRLRTARTSSADSDNGKRSSCVFQEVTDIVKLAALMYVLGMQGFHGNSTRYFLDENSFVNAVLRTKRGIPISLAMVYMVVGARIGLQLQGINSPFHFLLSLTCHSSPSPPPAAVSSSFSSSSVTAADAAPPRVIYVDAFHNMCMNSTAAIRFLGVASVDPDQSTSRLLPRCKLAEIFFRMMSNLSYVYQRSEDARHQHMLCLSQLEYLDRQAHPEASILAHASVIRQLVEAVRTSGRQAAFGAL